MGLVDRCAGVADAVWQWLLAVEAGERQPPKRTSQSDARAVPARLEHWQEVSALAKARGADYAAAERMLADPDAWESRETPTGVEVSPPPAAVVRRDVSPKAPQRAREAPPRPRRPVPVSPPPQSSPEKPGSSTTPDPAALRWAQRMRERLCTGQAGEEFNAVMRRVAVWHGTVPPRRSPARIRMAARNGAAIPRDTRPVADRIADAKRRAAEMREAIAERGGILDPCFAQARAQELQERACATAALRQQRVSAAREALRR